MSTKHLAAEEDPMVTLAEELKGLGGMEPVIFASKFKGQRPVSQAYRDLFAARLWQSRMFRRFHRVHGPLGGGDYIYGDRFAALESIAAASLSTIRNSGVVT